LPFEAEASALSKIAGDYQSSDWPLRYRNALAAVYSWLSPWPLSAQVSEIAQRAFGAFLMPHVQAIF
jgi:hypothetical protein